MKEKMRAYHQCDCGRLTKNDNGFCSDKCMSHYNNTILNIKTNHIILPESKFDDLNTDLFEMCELTINLKMA